MKYSHPCPHGCGANLDSGERCDCQDAIPKSTNRPSTDRLYIGVDLATNGEEPILVVMKYLDDGDITQVPKIFTGKEAIKIYDLLTIPDKTIKQILEENT